MIQTLPEIFITFLSLGFLGGALFMAAQLDRLLQTAAALLALGCVGLFWVAPEMGLAAEAEASLPLLALDFFTRSMIQTLWCVAAVLFLIFRLTLRPDRIVTPEVPALVLFSLLGMMLLMAARSWMVFVVGLELMALPLFVMAALQRENRWAALGALKYFILTGFATALILYGIVLIFGATTSLDFAAFWGHLEVLKTPLFQMGLLLVLAGLFFKLGVVPFHWWVPDVYRAMPWTVVSLFTTLPKVALLGVLMLLLGHGVVLDMPFLQEMLSGIAMLSMIIGALGALRARNLRVWFAFAGINQMGYMLMGLVVGTPQGFIALLAYLAIYLMMLLGFWGLFLPLPWMGHPLTVVDDLRWVQRWTPWRALGMSLLLFSMAGLPPFAGFFVKVHLFEVAITRGHFALVIVGALTSVLAAFYYLRMIRMLVMNPHAGTAPSSHFDAPKAVNCFALFAIVTLGFFWTSLPAKALKVLAAMVAPLF